MWVKNIFLTSRPCFDLLLHFRGYHYSTEWYLWSWRRRSGYVGCVKLEIYDPHMCTLLVAVFHTVLFDSSGYSGRFVLNLERLLKPSDVLRSSKVVVQGEHKVFRLLQTFITRKLRGIRKLCNCNITTNT